MNTVITGRARPLRSREARRGRASSGSSRLSRENGGGPVAVIGDMWLMTKQTAVALIDFPVKVYYTAYNLVTGEPRDIYGPMSIVGASRAAGEIAATDQIAAPDKVATLFTVLASVNLFVGLFNFVPLLPLDGGHMAGALYEGARRGWAPLFRRPDPGMWTRRGCFRSRTSSAASSCSRAWC